MTESYQPQRRVRPVLTPTSPPVVWRYSHHLSKSSVGNGPAPTRVVYALIMPSEWVMRVGPMPEPTDAPPAVGLEEVTNGQVPWSTSSIVAWPPSMSTCFPASRVVLRRLAGRRGG